MEQSFAYMNNRPPLIDAHNHLGRWLGADGGWVPADLAGGAPGLPWTVPDVGALLELMDAGGIAAIVNLDGRWDAELEANLDRYDRARPGRFATFCQLDWSLAARGDDFAGPLVASLERSAAAGARGLKVWKTLGLGWRDARGRLLLPGDERIAPVWEAAADLGLPVLIHTADPPAFFLPFDARNPRWEMLKANPDWSFHGGDYPSFEQLMWSFEALVAAHPRTTFVGAHGVDAENLPWLTRMLDAYPNLVVDFSYRAEELAADAAGARALLLRHPDRVLFGTDHFPPEAEAYAGWFALLESTLRLPPEVLDGVYRGNAARVLELELEAAS